MEPRSKIVQTPLGEQRLSTALIDGTGEGRLRITCPARDELLLADLAVEDVESFLVGED